MTQVVVGGKSVSHVRKLSTEEIEMQQESSFNLNEKGSGLTEAQKNLLQIVQMHSSDDPYAVEEKGEKRTAFALQQKGLIVLMRITDGPYLAWEKEI